MSSDFVRALLTEQRKRLVATILGYIERNISYKLTTDERLDLRDEIKDAINNYHDCVLDCLKASVNDGGMFNEHALTMLTKMNEQLRTVASRLPSETSTAAR
jgi:hypothetical protein